MSKKSMTTSEEIILLDKKIEETQKMLDECNAYIFKYKTLLEQHKRYGFAFEPLGNDDPF